MKLSNALLLATAITLLAMVALPADAQSISFGPLRFQAGPLLADDKRSYGRPPPPTPKKPKPTIGAPVKWAVSRFATGDAPSAVGAPTNTAGTPGTASPTKRLRRRGRRRSRRHPGRRRVREVRARQKRETAGAAGGTAAASTTRMFQFPVSYAAKDMARRIKEQQIDLRNRIAKILAAETDYSLSDGYNYEAFDDEYDEGYSVENEAFRDDEDAWEDMYDGGDFSVAGEGGAQDADEE